MHVRSGWRHQDRRTYRLFLALMNGPAHLRPYFVMTFLHVLDKIVKSEIGQQMLQGKWTNLAFILYGSSGNRVDESNGKCGLKPHGYCVFEVSGWVAARAVRNNQLDVLFRLPDAQSPHSVGMSGDDRELGLSLRWIRLDAT